jgi:stage V sporulation protein G
MEITEVRFTLRNEDRLKAYASITLDDCFVVRGIRVIAGNDGLFVAMPSRKSQDGRHLDIAHPIKSETREYITKRIIEEYQKELEVTGNTK